MGSLLMICLTRPEALRAEASILHGMADLLDPSHEACPHCGHGFRDGATDPLATPFVSPQGSEDPRLHEAGVLKHADQANLREGI